MKLIKLGLVKQIALNLIVPIFLVLTLSLSQEAPYYLIKIVSFNTNNKECNVSLDPNNTYTVPLNKTWTIYFNSDNIIDDYNFSTRYRTITIDNVVYKVKKIGSSQYFCTSQDLKFPLKLKSGTKIKFSKITMDYMQYQQPQSVEVCESTSK